MGGNIMTNSVTFIGDIHGDWLTYGNIIDSNLGADTIQVGDMGVGFERFTRSDKINDPRGFLMNILAKEGNHTFIRGNHDDPAGCKALAPYWIDDGYHDSERDIFHVGGAWSIDWQNRIEGVTWWPDEELSIKEMNIIMDKYEYIKPSIMVTHDAPYVVIDAMYGGNIKFHENRTAQFLGALFEIHEPDLWVFGHWHENKAHKMGKTDFRMIGIAQTLTMTI